MGGVMDKARKQVSWAEDRGLENVREQTGTTNSSWGLWVQNHAPPLTGQGTWAPDFLLVGPWEEQALKENVSSKSFSLQPPGCSSAPSLCSFCPHPTPSCRCSGGTSQSQALNNVRLGGESGEGGQGEEADELQITR